MSDACHVTNLARRQAAVAVVVAREDHESLPFPMTQGYGRLAEEAGKIGDGERERPILRVSRGSQFQVPLASLCAERPTGSAAWASSDTGEVRPAVRASVPQVGEAHDG